MTLSVALQTANSGLMAAQTGLRAVSDNIANVNTPGYVRKTVDQEPLVVNGVGMGVEVTGVRRVTDQYLQLASLTAASDAARWGTYSQYLDNAQSLFGDPSQESFFFNRLDQIYAAFGAAANDPSSSLSRSQALANVQDFLSEAARINGQLGELGGTVDTRISADVDAINGLLRQINQLNTDISRAKVVNADSSGSENIQSQLLDQLAGLMNIQVTQLSSGGVVVRSADGVLLSGQGAATLSYNRTDATKGHIVATPPGGGIAQPIQVTSGEIRGLLDLRDQKLPSIQDQLGEFVARSVDALNAAHNASTAIPPLGSLTGRDTGLDIATAAAGFTGHATLAITSAAGVVQRRVDIDFDAGVLSVDGGAPSAFTAATFDADLNSALGAFGSVTFSDGRLSIITAAGNGAAVDEGTSAKAGRGFSHFFGLNDLVRSSGFTNYDTGLRGTDSHGFIPGEQMTLRLAQPDGKPIRDVTITVPAAATMDDLLAALNDTTTGVGLYGQFKLDPQGQLAFAPFAVQNASVSVVQDDTHRGANGPSISQLFGLGVGPRGSRASQFEVDQALMSDPTKLALGRLDLTVAAGAPALRAGDGRGALALAGAGEQPLTFKAGGSLGVVTMTLSRYAAEFGGSIGRDAAAAETRSRSATSVQSEAVARRQSVESVNLDEELVKLTTYQQAFSASARMIQAAKDLFDILLQM